MNTIGGGTGGVGAVADRDSNFLQKSQIFYKNLNISTKISNILKNLKFSTKISNFLQKSQILFQNLKFYSKISNFI